MAEHDENEKNDDGNGNHSDFALTDPAVGFIKTADRPSVGDHQGGASVSRETSESHNKRGNLQFGYAESIDRPRQQSN